MVRVHMPADTSKPIMVSNNRSKRVEIQEDKRADYVKSVKESSRRARNMAESESSFPRMSLFLDVLSMFGATTLGSLALLPLSLHKTMSQLPRMAGQSFAGSTKNSIRANFIGAKASLAESTVKFGFSALLPPQLSLLASYVSTVPIRGAIQRAQSGAANFRTALPKILSRRGLSSAWSAHLVRDVPFTLIEAFFLSVLFLRKPENRLPTKTQGSVGRTSTVVSTGNNAARQTVESRREDFNPAHGSHAIDGAIAACVTAAITVPLDLVRTRMLVAGRPSILRTARAVMRLAKRRGSSLFLTSSSPRYYVAECVARPVVYFYVYALLRATLVATWLQSNAEQEDKQKVVIE